MTRTLQAAALLAAVLVNVACQTSDSPTIGPQPTIVEPPSTTDTFTGTVAVKTFSASNNFTVSQAGSIAVTLTAAGPPSTIPMGLGVGNPLATDTTQCVVFQTGFVVTAAGTAPQIVGTISQTGAYCVSVFDASLINGVSGSQSDTVTYTVTVKHPI